MHKAPHYHDLWRAASEDWNQVQYQNRYQALDSAWKIGIQYSRQFTSDFSSPDPDPLFNLEDPESINSFFRRIKYISPNGTSWPCKGTARFIELLKSFKREYLKMKKSQTDGIFWAGSTLEWLHLGLPYTCDFWRDWGWKDNVHSVRKQYTPYITWNNARSA